ncbi:MAG: threonylcarbamoyl-AMP synthase [Candidatus Melainabacteria bacterium RIFCSPLOWO2_02_FULL_35_15]|nr:MAG: threonylcarbamoyl-AMP synthase [Candidatus Melainabacteria bacterium RIFCSPLOWO2_02_FULL_35_15]
MKNSLKLAIELIKSNKPIIIPTDTVYGLVCRYDSKSAVEKIYKLKKRDRKKPLILLGYNWQALRKFVIGNDYNHSLQMWIRQWPGPLTLVLSASKKTPEYLNEGFKTIGIRVPNNKFLLTLLKHCPKKVLASTSANISGKSDKKLPRELIKKVKLFVKARKGEMSLKPSRVIEIKNNSTKILR